MGVANLQFMNANLDPPSSLSVQPQTNCPTTRCISWSFPGRMSEEENNNNFHEVQVRQSFSDIDDR